MKKNKRLFIYILLIVNLLIIGYSLSDFGKKVIWGTDQEIEDFHANELERMFYVQ